MNHYPLTLSILPIALLSLQGADEVADAQRAAIEERFAVGGTDLVAVGTRPRLDPTKKVRVRDEGIRLVRQGYRVGIVDFTKGELGSRGTPEGRREEAQAAAAIIGLAVRENLGFPDGDIENSRQN